VIKRLLLSLTIIALLSATAVAATSQPSSAQACDYQGGVVDCYGWEFNYDMSSASVTPTGLTLNDLVFGGESMMYQAHFASLPVKYDDDACGPYVDLFSTVTNSSPTGVQADTFNQDGVAWLELGAHYQIGSYVLYTAFYFSDLGEMQMRIFARGLQCNVHHVHYPMFVVDADVEGPTVPGANGLPNHGPGDEIYYNDGTGWIPQTVETDNRAALVGHDFIVRDPDSTKTVAISYDDGIFAAPSGDTFDVQASSENIIYTRQSNGAAELAWPGANAGQSFLGSSGFNGGEWGYGDGETITDPVIVVRGFLDHAVGGNLPDDWHTSGISVKFIEDPLAPPATPTPEPTATPVPATPVPPTPVPTATAVPPTPTPEPTATAVPPTPTAVPPTPVPLTPVPTPTAVPPTPVPPTPEPTSVPPTPVPTPTVVPPTPEPTSVPPTPTPVEGDGLANGVPITGLAGNAGDLLRYSFEVPADATEYTVAISGDGDADLYTLLGAEPTLSDWDCRPYLDRTSDEICTGTVPPSGTVNILVRGYRTFSKVQLLATHNGGDSVPTPTPVPATPEPTSVPPTSVPTATAVPPTPTPEPTATAVPPTPTAVPPTPVPPTPVPTPTAVPPTPVPPTPEPTSVPPTPVPTPTAVPPTPEPTSVPPTPIPTPTPTPTTPAGSGVLTTGVPVNGLSGAAGSELRYSFTVPAGATSYTVLMTGSGDADLYTRLGGQATISSWDCRPYKDYSSVESCTASVPPSGKVSILIRGYRAFSNVSITASFQEAGDDNVLSSGDTITGLSGASGSTQYYTVEVPQGASRLVVRLDNSTGDADLYTRAGQAPTTSQFDCRPYLGGVSDEVCTINNPTPGVHQIMVRGWTAFSGAALTATVS